MHLLWVRRGADPGRSQGGPSGQIYSHPPPPPAKGWPAGAATAGCAGGPAAPLPSGALSPPSPRGPRRRPPHPYSLTARSPAEIAGARLAQQLSRPAAGFLCSRWAVPQASSLAGPAQDSPPSGASRLRAGRWEESPGSERPTQESRKEGFLGRSRGSGVKGGGHWGSGEDETAGGVG